MVVVIPACLITTTSRPNCTSVFPPASDGRMVVPVFGFPRTPSRWNCARRNGVAVSLQISLDSHDYFARIFPLVASRQKHTKSHSSLSRDCGHPRGAVAAPSSSSCSNSFSSNSNSSSSNSNSSSSNSNSSSSNSNSSSSNSNSSSSNSCSNSNSSSSYSCSNLSSYSCSCTNSYFCSRTCLSCCSKFNSSFFPCCCFVSNSNSSSLYDSSPITSVCSPVSTPLPVSIHLCPSVSTPLPVSIHLCPSVSTPLPVSILMSPSVSTPLPVSILMCPSVSTPLSVCILFCPSVSTPLPQTVQVGSSGSSAALSSGAFHDASVGRSMTPLQIVLNMWTSRRPSASFHWTCAVRTPLAILAWRTLALVD
ncbi:hypothetical protein FHG87_008440 [Trinorchestia longiramus]|nr:hypothetical protein FHG87_008440 [Trinorchestia longiramus]